MLCGECKYYCENCSSKQEAEKRMRIKKLPKLLALHLKRFKFVGSLNKFVKLTYRVVFPFELRLLNTVIEFLYYFFRGIYNRNQNHSIFKNKF